MESLPFKEVILSNDEICDRRMFGDEAKRITLENAAFYVFGGGTVLLSNLYSGDKIRPEISSGTCGLRKPFPAENN